MVRKTMSSKSHKNKCVVHTRLVAAGLRSGAALWFASLVMVFSPAHASPDVSGIWLTGAGDAKIEITRCGASICGRIVWLKEPIDRNTGKPQVDDKNPNPALANRRILGLSILSDMKSNGNSWTGRIYNADDGKTYEAVIGLESETALKIKGCAGPFCGSETWARAGRTASDRK